QRFARLVRATYEDNDTDRLVTEQEVYLENVAADGEPDNWIVAYPSLLDANVSLSATVPVAVRATCLPQCLCFSKRDGASLTLLQRTWICFVARCPQ
ncbi:MAG: hypothetical protein II630_06655, partial [Bacteroidales bacterium]|nr:hypothetical protein [Bacteroidales bacterium]